MATPSGLLPKLAPASPQVNGDFGSFKGKKPVSEKKGPLSSLATSTLATPATSTPSSSPMPPAKKVVRLPALVLPVTPDSPPPSAHTIRDRATHRAKIEFSASKEVLKELVEFKL